MRQMFLSRFCLLLLLMLLIGVAGMRSIADPAPQTVKSAKGYSITIPAEWTIQQQPDADTDLAALTSRGVRGALRENIHVCVETIKNSLTAQEYYVWTKYKSQVNMKDFSEVASGDFSGDGTCWKMVCRMPMDGIMLKDCVYCFTTQQYCYAIIGTASPETFATYEPIFDQIARSFSLAMPPMRPQAKPKRKYTLVLPNDWTEIKISRDADYQAFGPHRINLNIIVGPLENDMTPKEFYTECKADLQNIPNTSEDMAYAFTGNESFWKVVYHAPVANFIAQNCTYLTVKNKIGYIITCSAKQDNFRMCEPIFDQIVKSFTITDSMDASTATQGFTLAIPPDWKKIEPASKSIVLQAIAPQPAIAGINVMVAPLANDMTLPEFYAAKKQNLQATKEGFGEDKSGDFSGDGRCWKMVYHYSVNGTTMNGCMYFIVKDNTAYYLTATATSDFFAKYQPIFDQIGHTFKVTP